MSRHSRIQHWDDERSLGNSLIVTLIPGFAFEPSPDEKIAQHVDGFDSVDAAMKAVRSARVCSCSRCKGETK